MDTSANRYRTELVFHRSDHIPALCPLLSVRHAYGLPMAEIP